MKFNIQVTHCHGILIPCSRSLNDLCLLGSAIDHHIELNHDYDYAVECG